MLSFDLKIPRALVASPFEAMPGSINLVAIVILCIVSAILIRGIRESAKFNDVIMITKVTVVILFIGIEFK